MDLKAIRHNYRKVKAHVGPDIAVMAVLKSNAYGHGIELVGPGMADEADWFGVSTLEEGIRLRRVGVQIPVLVFEPCGPWNAKDLVTHNLTATVDSDQGGDALAKAGAELGVTPQAHIKIDTGMSRYGIRALDRGGIDAEIVQPWLNHQDIRWTGMYTHLSNATQEDPANAEAQANLFLEIFNVVSTLGFHPKFTHVLNSAGILRMPTARFRMVRTGTLLYGQYPDGFVPKTFDLHPTWRFRARIVSLRTVQRGSGVGYGHEWKATRETTIATVPVGYYDGFTVEPLSVWKRRGGMKGLAKHIAGRDRVCLDIAGQPVAVVGRIAAQSTMVDVTEIRNVKIGDIVDIPARRLMVGDHIARLPRAPDAPAEEDA